MPEPARQADRQDLRPSAVVLEFSTPENLMARLSSVKEALLAEGRRMEPDRLRQRELVNEVTRLQARIAHLAGDPPPHTD
jgi:hypothetical protein